MLPLAAAIAVLLLLAACTGGQGGGNQAASSAAAGESAPATEEASESAGGDVQVVLLQDFAFEPAELTVAPGTTVSFQNLDAAPHTATHGEDGEPADDALFDLALPETDDLGDYAFDEAGEFSVTCKIHPEMNMTITVEE